MQETSNGAGSKEWLDVSKKFVLTAYVDSVPVTLMQPDEEHTFIREDFEGALKKVSRRRKRGQTSS